jgi:hypothetical protein
MSTFDLNEDGSELTDNLGVQNDKDKQWLYEMGETIRHPNECGRIIVSKWNEQRPPKQEYTLDLMYEKYPYTAIKTIWNDITGEKVLKRKNRENRCHIWGKFLVFIIILPWIFLILEGLSGLISLLF